jgi:hypothetical protein
LQDLNRTILTYTSHSGIAPGGAGGTRRTCLPGAHAEPLALSWLRALHTPYKAVWKGYSAPQVRELATSFLGAGKRVLIDFRWLHLGMRYLVAPFPLIYSGSGDKVL